MLRRRTLITKQKWANRKAALFVDRDGVIIEDMHYVKNIRDVQLCAGAADLIEYCNKVELPAVVVTNQSGISRGYFTWSDYDRVTDRMIELLGDKARITGIYANGYGPNHKSATWRKPSCGMVLAAAKDLHLDIASSILIGDRLSDMQCGYSAGVGNLVHVKTGKGSAERDLVNEWWEAQAEIDVSMRKSITMTRVASLIDFPKEFLTS